eukprot:m.134886 g.134886  ORF g.134886 m.134886 type:complete len:64 (+) comp13966_c0_seq3:1973-2164(+)
MLLPVSDAQTRTNMHIRFSLTKAICCVKTGLYIVHPSTLIELLYPQAVRYQLHRQTFLVLSPT